MSACDINAFNAFISDKNQHSEELANGIVTCPITKVKYSIGQSIFLTVHIGKITGFRKIFNYFYADISFNTARGSLKKCLRLDKI